MTHRRRDDARASRDGAISTVAMALRSEADARTSVAPAQKPLGASSSFGRGVVKPPEHGTLGIATPRAKENDPHARVRSRVAATQNANIKTTIRPPAASAMVQKPKKSRSRPPAPAPAPAPARAAAPPAPSAAVSGGLVAAASGMDNLHPALVPFKAGDWSVSTDTAPASTATALVVGCTLHDLTPEDKRKVAKLIKQVVEYAESKKRLEAELDETHSRLDSCERSRDAARKAEETRKAELRALTTKLDKALATVEAYRRRENRSLPTPEKCANRENPEMATLSLTPAAPELWRVSPMTRAVVDEVRAVLRRGRERHGEGGGDGVEIHARALVEERPGDGGSPAERRRPPLTVAPTAAKEPSRREGRNAKKAAGLGPSRAAAVVYAPTPGMTSKPTDATEEDSQDRGGHPLQSPTKALRMRAAAAAAAAAAGAESRARGGAFLATPELPEEVRAAARAAAFAASPEDACTTAFAAGAAGAAASSGGSRRWTTLPTPPGAAREGGRVLRFDPHRGAAGAFYFDDSSETASEARSERAACEASTVRRALGVPEAERKPREPPRGISRTAATYALVRLEDDMTAYGARATSAREPWWERDCRADANHPEAAEATRVTPLHSRKQKRASAFAPVVGEGKGRLATIAARMARDDAYVDRDAAPRSPHVPAPPASLIAAAARARVRESSEEGPTVEIDGVRPSRGRLAPRTVASPLVTTTATTRAPAASTAATRSGNGFPREEDRDAGAARATEPGSREGRRPLDPTRLSRAHAAVRAAAAAVDAALASDARVDVDVAEAAEASEKHSRPGGFGAPAEAAGEAVPGEAHATGSCGDAHLRGTAFVEADPVPRVVRSPGRIEATRRDRTGNDEARASSPSPSRRPRRAVALDANLIDLVDEVDELRVRSGDEAESVESFWGHRRLGRDAARPANPRAAAAAAARRVAERARGVPEKSRRRRLADEVTRREARRRRAFAAAEKVKWCVNYRSFSEGKRGEPLL